MIDLHCHMLPGIDDGPDTLEQSVAMARLAVKNGIRKAVLTPHLHPGRYDNNFYTIFRKYKEFESVLNLLDIPLELGMAAEIRLGEEILPFFKKAIIPSLGEFDGYKVILLEFPHSHIPL
ncbi:MAG: CpsB/CapC family capsule biosynthesis tyrosine phosphatase, partial [Gammaproteobacteria bacterium]|nr:CpsB/CapC family capsule biosynthesis tyrosine phosphatase [Gammaproteobacteria bacterium]